MFIVPAIAGIMLLSTLLATQAALAGGPDGPPPLEGLPPAQGAIHNGSLVSVLSLPNGGMQNSIHTAANRIARSRSATRHGLVAGPMEWPASRPPDWDRVCIHRCLSADALPGRRRDGARRLSGADRASSGNRPVFMRGGWIGAECEFSPGLSTARCRKSGAPVDGFAMNYYPRQRL